MPSVLVDTDLFVDHLRGAHELHSGKHDSAYSVVTRAELLAGTTATGAVAQLLSPFREFAIDRAVAGCLSPFGTAAGGAVTEL